MNAPKNKIHEAEILKLKHERDTAEEVMQGYVIQNTTKHKSANFNKIQNQFRDR